MYIFYYCQTAKSPNEIFNSEILFIPDYLAWPDEGTSGPGC